MSQIMLAAAIIASTAGIFSKPAYCQPAPAAVSAAPAGSDVQKELQRGYTLKGQERIPEAVAAFEGVLTKDPHNQAALVELGYLNAGRKHYMAAVKYLGAASAQDPDNMRLHMDLGYAFQGLKRGSEAQKQFKIVASAPGELQAAATQALSAVPVSPQREKGYAALKRGDKAAARKDFEAAVASDPHDAASLKQLGYLDLAAGKPAAAAESFEAASALDPTDYSMALQLGYTYDALNQKERSRKAFGAALASPDPKIHDAAHQALGPATAAAAPVESGPAKETSTGDGHPGGASL